MSAGSLAGLAGCSGDSARTLPSRPTGAWRQHAHDARNTGVADVVVPPRGTRAWDAGTAQLAAPLVDDGIVFAVSEAVSAMDAQTGDEQWRVELEGTADYTPGLVDDRLLVATESRVRALSRADGTERWSVSLPRPIDGALTVASDLPLLVPIADTGLLALDPETGERLWRAPMLGVNPAAVADGTVYVTGYKQDGNTAAVRGLAAADGTRQWEIELEAPDSPPVVGDGALLVAAGETLSVHDPTDGTRKRTLGPFDGRLQVPPAVTDGTAFVATDSSLQAVSIADGSQVWRADLQVMTDTGVSAGRETVVAPVLDLPDAGGPGLTALARSDGTTRWEHSIDGFDAVVSTPPILADGAVFYVSTESAGVTALGDLPARTDG